MSEKPKSDLDVIVGSNVVYAQKIERLDPYLFPAMEKSKSDLKSRIDRALASL